MSTVRLVLPWTTRLKPRWSVLRPAAALLLPASMAGLVEVRGMVFVGPPLLARPAAASCGLVFMTPAPLVVAPFWVTIGVCTMLGLVPVIVAVPVPALRLLTMSLGPV